MSRLCDSDPEDSDFSLNKTSPRSRSPISFKSDSNIKDSLIGPALPPHLQQKLEVIGPALPPHLLNKSQSNEESELFIGPALPVHLREKPSGSEATVIGPALPPQPLQEYKVHEATGVPQEFESSEDEEMYGPVLPGATIHSRSQIALEERALELKLHNLDPQEDQTPVREEWMLELPEVKAAKFGLGPRQFRAKAGPDMSDRSSWTDTPDKKKNKKEPSVDLKQVAQMKEIQRRDKEQEKLSRKHKDKNKESLLDIHQKKLKKQKKDDGGPSERRPFSREIDLQVNRFDEAQKKAVLKKAQLLDNRFSSGQSKFL